VAETLGQTIAHGDIQQELDALPVLDLCAVETSFYHQSLGVHQQVALASFDLLGSVVTTLFAAHARGFTDWLSAIAALGLGFLLRRTRTRSRRAA
jgi:hypothetical protein